MHDIVCVPGGGGGGLLKAQGAVPFLLACPALSFDYMYTFNLKLPACIA